MDSSSSSPAPTSGLPRTSTSNGNGESQKKNEEEVSKLKNAAHPQAGTNGQLVPDLPEDGQQVDVGTTARMPAAMAESAPRTTDTAVPSAGPGAQPHVVRMTAKDGSEIRIDSQIQLYVSNDLVVHPLVSPALSYLGGLPPMLFIIGDKEVLRDEGIYT
jgi:acetyl esterase/lipase